MPTRHRCFTCLLLCIAYASCWANATDAWYRLSIVGQPGRCSVNDWEQNWPGCEFEDGVSEGHLAIDSLQDQPAWKITCAAGSIGPERGGVGWRWPINTQPKPSVRQSAELRYTLRFEPGFEFVKGGKLPGLCGGPKTITGGDKCTGYDGWSARLMWRRDGKGQAYVYHPSMKQTYGDEFDFPDSFRFPVNEAVGIRIAIEMNHAGKADGSLRVWSQLPGQQEQLMIERLNMLWTKAPEIGVDSVLFNVFHGGNDKSWAPSHDCFIKISDIAIR